MGNNQNKQSENLAGLRSARETVVPVKSRPAPSKSESVFAICLETDDPALLVPLKVYGIDLRGEFARVVDEAGDVVVYPLEYFLPLSLPHEEAVMLSDIQTKIAA